MSVKDFKRGVEFQARTHYIFMRKQGEATKELSKRIIKKIDTQGKLINVLADELTQRDMDRIFGIHTSLDIGTLDDSDKIKLLSYLKTLLTQYKQSTQQQNEYFLTVKKYLNIANVSADMNLSSVSELDISLMQLKAFLECVCEFLFLKNGSRIFAKEFERELECFGFNDKILNEIIDGIESTYTFFGVQGIIEHYDLQPIQHESSDTQNPEPPVIPFFNKPIVLVYSSRSKHGEVRAKMLQICIYERLKELNLECSVEIYPGNEAKKKKNTFERDNVNIIYIGEPTMSNPLSATIDIWEFDKLGMKYVTRGQESIIKVKELKKKQYKEFLEFATEQQLRQEIDIKKNLRSQEDTILGTAFDKDEPLAVNIMAGILGSWLILPSAILDLWNKADDKAKLKNLQYSIAIDKFVSSKINPYISTRK